MSRRARTWAVVLAVTLLLAGLSNVGRLRTADDDGIPTGDDDRVAVGVVPGADVQGGTPRSFTLGSVAGSLRVVATVSDRLAGASARPPSHGRFVRVRWSLPGGTSAHIGGATTTVLAVRAGERSIRVAEVEAGDGGAATVAVPAGSLRVTVTAAERTSTGDPETGEVVSAGLSRAWGSWTLPRSLRREVAGVFWSIGWTDVPGLCTTYLPSKGWSAPGRAWLAIAPASGRALSLLAHGEPSAGEPAYLPVTRRQVDVPSRSTGWLPDPVVTPSGVAVRDLQVVDVPAGCRVPVDVRLRATAQRPATSTAPVRTSRLDVTARLEPVATSG